MDNHDDVGVNALNFQELMDSKVPNYCQCVGSREWDEFRVGGGTKGTERDCCETGIYGARVVAHVPCARSSRN